MSNTRTIQSKPSAPAPSHGAPSSTHRHGAAPVRTESTGDLAAWADDLAAQPLAFGLTLQRQVPGGGQQHPAEQQADAMAAQVTGAPGVMITDSAPTLPGQLSRDDFLAQLKAAVMATAQRALEPTWSALGCPYIERWFAQHASSDGATLDRLARRYSGVSAPRHATDYIAPICARVWHGIQRWRSGEDIAGELGAAGVSGTDPAASPGNPAPSPVPASGVQTKQAPGETPADPASLARIAGELGEGAPLHPAVASRIGQAYGQDFSGVRVHTDSTAGARAQSLGALAFTLGDDVAFAPNQYRPSTLPGDALIAHELAHVAQQRGGRKDKPALHRKAGGADSGMAHEVEADRAAFSAVAELYAGDRQAAGVLAGRVVPALTTPLRLQRCDPSTTSAPTPAPPVPASAASGGPDLLAGTKAPDETTKDEIDKILNPTVTGGKKKKAFIAKDFQAHMDAAVTKWMNSSFKYYDKLAKGGPDTLLLDMPQVRKTGQAAQKVVKDKWGAYIKGAAPDSGTATSDPAFDVSDPKVLHPQEDTIDPLAKADKDAVVAGLIEYAIRQKDGGQKVATDHNLDPSRPVDLKARNDFIAAFMKKPGNYAKLVQIQRMWPGEEHPWDHTVYIQLRRFKDPALDAKAKADPTLVDAQLRLGYWASFLTLIHEYIHAAAHANFIRNEGSGQQNQVLSEGGDDWLVTQLLKGLLPKIPGDDALREMVEGKKYPYNSAVIPGPSRYDEWTDVDAIVKKMGPNGEANFVAAYFLGHVELLGLGTWNKGMAGGADTYDVLVDNFPVSIIAERTFVDEATIRSANGLGATGDLKKGLATVPGIVWHSCVPNDNLTVIAQQHGVTEDALKKANPYVGDWNKLFDGQQILIPRH